MDQTEPRQYTDEEVRDRFLDHLAHAVRYWLNESRVSDTEAKMTGLVHSILATIDGSAAGLPGFILAPSPHPDDEEFHRREGENWYPRVEAEHDIAGGLHEHWYPALHRAGVVR